MARQESTRRAYLSNEQLQRLTGWERRMVEDYQGIQADSTAIFDDLDAIETTLNEHIESDSEHGVTGENVGTEDFAQSAIGGVVYLADLVDDALESTAEVTIADAPASTAEVVIDDVGAAPLVYDQAYADEQTALINDIKAKHNTLLVDVNTAITLLNDVKAKHNALLIDVNLTVVQFNELLTNVKAAKQMSDT